MQVGERSLSLEEEGLGWFVPVRQKQGRSNVGVLSAETVSKQEFSGYT
jgi:hypothetical protein